MTDLFFTRLLLNFRQWKRERQLRWQTLLAQKGIGFRTELLNVRREGNSLAGYVRVSLLLNLRVNGKIVCRRVFTLLKEEGMLKAGDKVVIRYIPGNARQVLLCSRI